MFGLKARNLALAAAALAAVTAAGSCVYFNTLYNARKIYGEAEEMREEKDGDVDRNLKEKYGEVIEKCAKIVRDHPDSRWVDDAVFLMGQSLVRQGEYDKGIRKFVELTTNYPESGYVPESYYWLALANYEKGENNQALLQAQRFIEAYPDHERRWDVMFLAGDIGLALDDHELALEYYSRVATGGDNDNRREALLRSAELHYMLEDWEKAAEGYESILGKGMPWSREYSIKLALAECYTKLGRCREALELSDDLRSELTVTRDKPPVELSRAMSFECMDSLETAIKVYERVASSYPRSDFSAEAYFRLGVIYHEKLDSLQKAQEAYAKVGNESASSDFAAEALQRSNSLRRLIELEAGGPESEGADARAEKKFLAAEIQLTRLGETDLALGNYRAVVDSFPETEFAPRAAYAIGWIHHREKGDTAAAVETFAGLIRKYPVSYQARGALDELGLLGEGALRAQLAAYIDSAAADTVGMAAEMARARAEADSAAAIADSTAAVTLPADTAGVDTSRAPSRGQVKKDTTYPLPGAAGTAGADSARAGSTEAGGKEPADTTSTGEK